MRNFRGIKSHRIEFVLTLIFLVASLVFSFERRDYFVENALEPHYSSLVEFGRIHAYLRGRRLKAKDLYYSLAILEKLRDKSFILCDDVSLDMASAYEKLGQKNKSERLLKQLLKESGDSLSAADGVLQLANLYRKQRRFSDAIRLLEGKKALFKRYRYDEWAFLTARLYHLKGLEQKAGFYMAKVHRVKSSLRSGYVSVIRKNWDVFSRNEQANVLKALSGMGMYKSYSELGQKYIASYKPKAKEVEQLALDLVFHVYKAYAATFVNSLKAYPQYRSVYREMMELHTLSHRDIESRSARVRGAYYYRKLSYLRRLSRYSATKAEKIYKRYLKGEVEPRHAKLNLMIAIRNLLAYKKYVNITNLVESTYKKLDMTNGYDYLDDGISFWNAYAHFVLGDEDRALIEFENAIAVQPDSYYALNSHSYILLILKHKKLSRVEYLSHLESQIQNQNLLVRKLRLSKILYAFKIGVGKDLLKRKIVKLMMRDTETGFFNMGRDVVRRLHMDPNYIRFVAYTRYGFLTKARALLDSMGVKDEKMREILLLKELIKNKKFKSAHRILVGLKQDDFLNRNFAFLPREVQEAYYPRPYNQEVNLALMRLEGKSVIDPNLVYSVIRGESMYMTRAHSRVGARGLMQLMPSTARLISHKVLGQSRVNLYNAQNNILLGSYYLNENVRRVGLFSAIATYNGGYAVIKKMERKFHPANEIEMMEIHPYKETRNYIKKIISNYERYKELYNESELSAKLPFLQKGRV